MEAPRRLPRQPHLLPRSRKRNWKRRKSPEMMPVLAAAAAELLGKKVRILSARKLEAPRQGLSPWSQQGRVFVQASHNLRAVDP